MQILDGKKINNEISEKLSNEISKLNEKPCLAIIQVGDNSASNLYIKNKINFAEKIGAITKHIKLDEKTSTEDLIKLIQEINNDNSVHGIIIQMPLPNEIDTNKIFSAIKKEKDVDGLSPENIFDLFKGNKGGHVPATARGIKTLLEKYQIDLISKKIVVIGRSVLVGKSTAMNLINSDATVTICHSKTKDLISYTKNADIIIVAVGKAGFLTDEHLSENQILIDVGINADGNGVLVGDTLIQSPEKLSHYAMVPGGVGPMTVASLFENLLDAYFLQNN